MRSSRILLLSLLLSAAAPALAQRIVSSPAPGSVDVTIYRAPHRGPGEAMNLRWLNGYALISETRRIAVPAGESDIRFEGVAGGILPESAIVTGLPTGVVEKNQDAMLLSAGSLLDASLGRRVHLRRTSRATGAVRETEALIRSAESGAVVLETETGTETLRCTGLAETLIYDRVPPGLSAKPTLSVKVRSQGAATATVTLSYLASDFDWQASYVAHLSPDGTRMDLFAWLTLANADETSFRNADTQAVAGNLRRSSIRAPRARAQPLTLECWPQGTTTSDLEEIAFEREEIEVSGSRVAMRVMPAAMAPPPPPPPPSPAMEAQQEDLGDLKLYRIPEPVTVAARSQKQVALLRRQSVAIETVYRERFYGFDGRTGGNIARTLATRNTEATGLGLPLPAGRVALFAEANDRRLLIGRGTMRDHAVGEKVEIAVGNAQAVTAALTPLSPSDSQIREWEIVVANASSAPIRYEAEFSDFADSLTWSTPLTRRDGWRVWAVTVPANGRATMRVSGVMPKR
jgi:hypothetical protein